jgi:hypothetical protein
MGQMTNSWQGQNFLPPPSSLQTLHAASEAQQVFCSVQTEAVWGGPGHEADITSVYRKF